jgi:hypothetical protein
MSNIYPNILFDTEIPQIIFAVLGLSITIATFLPALVYSYNKDILKSLLQPNPEKDGDKWIRIVSFIYTNDLLLTQSMIQVVFSAFYGLLLFTDYTMKFNYCPKVWLICFPAFIILGFHWKLAFFWSKKKIKELFTSLEKENKISFWKDAYSTKKIWTIISIINLSLTSIFILLVFFFFLIFEKCQCRSHIIILFICVEAMILICLSVSWLIPLIRYNPLMSEVDEYTSIYLEKEERIREERIREEKENREKEGEIGEKITNDDPIKGN